MKGKLIKNMDDGWPVFYLQREDRKMIATTQWPFSEPSLMIAKNAGIELQKLSHENCEKIFGIYHPSELSKVLPEGERGAFEFGYCLAREHNSHKVFTVEDIHKAIELARKFKFDRDEMNYTTVNFIETNIIQSLQQPKEIEVEIEMECLDPNCDGIDKKGVCIPGDKPKLDSQGCLILKHVV